MLRFALVCAAILSVCVADKGGVSLSSGAAAYGAPIQPGYGAPQTQQVKYGGPIVYSGEKPPIIHFPPPPAQVRFCKDEPISDLPRFPLLHVSLSRFLPQTQAGYGSGKGGGTPPAVKYVPLPHHDLPVLIYQSVDKPPIHVVHTPRPAQV